jgi:Uma2 family endonuclease
MTTDTKLYTTEDLLAMPDDGVERWIIDGELFEGDHEMTCRNYPHSWLMSRISHLIEEWKDAQPQPRGKVVCGEAGLQLSDDPTTTVGVDVAYISPEVASATPRDARLIVGAPVLAVEILSPSDTQEGISRKITSYLENGVQSVWEVDPVFETVTVYSPDADPAMYNKTQTIPAIAGMPGFEPAVAAIFS